MPPARTVLIADPDPGTVRLLAAPLRRRGYQVQAARDGARALQAAILRSPDLVLLDEEIPVLDARSLVRILRTNPRTERIPVLLTGHAVDPDRARLGTFLRKPLQLDEVLARIEQLFRRTEAARAAGESREIEGNLAQIPLVDLLQVLAMNRKSGRLVVERDGERAEVALRDGRIVDARCGAAGAEKALWRLLGRREGQFAFVPGPPPGADRIDRRVEELILEGLRQGDELAPLLPLLPPPDALLELADGADGIPPDLHPVTAEVVRLLAAPRPLAEVIDGCAASDLEAARAIHALLERGYARRRSVPPPPAPAPEFLAPASLHALRARVARGRASAGQTIGKVVVVGGGPLARDAARARLAAIPGFALASQGPAAGFGTLGRLALGDGLRLDLVELPAEPELRPLWRPCAAGAIGALLLLPADEAAPLLAELVRALRLPVVVCGPAAGPWPAPLREPGVVAAAGGADAAEALRALLAGAGAAPPAA